MGSTPVKYLGAFLGLQDLSRANFEKPLRASRSVMFKWVHQSLTLDARILVMKTFVFSLLTHTLNVVVITHHQIDLIHKLLNDSVWQGRARVKQSVFCANYDDGGLKMLHVYDVGCCSLSASEVDEVIVSGPRFDLVKTNLVKDNICDPIITSFGFAICSRISYHFSGPLLFWNNLLLCTCE